MTWLGVSRFGRGAVILPLLVLLGFGLCTRPGPRTSAARSKK